MSLEYAQSRIKEALRLSGGNQVKARRQIIAWTFEDAKLLHALAKPHLSGIVAYNVERVASGRAEAAKKAKAEAQQQAVPKKAEKKGGPGGKDAEERFGLEILKAIAGSPQIFGLEDPGAPVHRAGVSQAHMDAIAALTKSNKKPD